MAKINIGDKVMVKDRKDWPSLLMVMILMAAPFYKAGRPAFLDI